jgi:LPS sulfotransferase NodH
MIKFVLLGYPRTGSNLLLSSLSRHPNIHVFSEVFNQDEEERQRSFSIGIQKSKSALPKKATDEFDENAYYRDGDDGAEFLRRRIFYEHALEPVAVGLKLFYLHARGSSNARKAWEYLMSDQDIRIIHLTRRNLLESLLSWRIACETQEWTLPKGHSPKCSHLPPLYLDPGRCAAYFDMIQTERQRVSTCFSNHPKLEIEYEQDLCQNFDLTVFMVEDFLQVERQLLDQIIEKQTKYQPWQQISNYLELKEHFRASSYAYFFE